MGKIDETWDVNDTLNLSVSEGNDLTVLCKGKGKDTPVKCDTDLDGVIDFGTLFTTHTEPKEIIIKNYGQAARRITWFKDKEKEKKKKDKKKEDAKAKDKEEKVLPPVFRVEPENV